MADTYAILGFAHDLSGPVVLYTSDSYTQCDTWREGYTRYGDWGGYDKLALYEVGPEQRPHSIHKHDSPVDIWESH